MVYSTNPNDASYRAGYATILTRLSSFDEALSHIQQAIKLDPKNRQYKQLQQQIRQLKRRN